MIASFGNSAKSSTKCCKRNHSSITSNRTTTDSHDGCTSLRSGRVDETQSNQQVSQTCEQFPSASVSTLDLTRGRVQPTGQRFAQPLQLQLDDEEITLRIHRQVRDHLVHHLPKAEPAARSQQRPQTSRKAANRYLCVDHLYLPIRCCTHIIRYTITTAEEKHISTITA